MIKKSKPKVSKAKPILSNWEQKRNEFENLSYEKRLLYWDDEKNGHEFRLDNSHSNNFWKQINPDISASENFSNPQNFISIEPNSEDEKKMLVNFIIKKCKESFPSKSAEKQKENFSERFKNSKVPEKTLESELKKVENLLNNNEIKQGYEINIVNGKTENNYHNKMYELLITGNDFSKVLRGFELAEYEGWLKKEFMKNDNSKISKPKNKKLIWNAPINVLGDILFLLKKELKNPETTKPLLEGDDYLIAEMISSYFSNIDSNETIKDCLNPDKRKRRNTTSQKFEIKISIEEKRKYTL